MRKGTKIGFFHTDVVFINCKLISSVIIKTTDYDKWGDMQKNNLKTTQLKGGGNNINT